MMDLYWTDENLRKAKRLAEMAGDLGLTAAQLSLAWCLRHPAVTSVISGVTKVSQLEDNLKAADAVIPDDVYQALNELFPGRRATGAS